MKTKIILFSIISILFFACITVAQMPIFTNVKGHLWDIFGNPLLNVTITAWVNGTERANTTSENNLGMAFFNIDVYGTYSDAGSPITFKIEGADGLENTTFVIGWIGDQNFTLHQQAVGLDILINEIQPSSTGWIELFNNGNHSLNLVNCSISGEANTTEIKEVISLTTGWNLISFPIEVSAESTQGTHTISENTMIRPADYILLNKNSTGIPLGNMTGTLQLKSPGGATYDNVSYDPVLCNGSWSQFPEGISIERLVDAGLAWNCTDSPTPGSTNN